MAYKDMTRRKIYLRYKYMLNRCYRKKDKEFKNYGGRGIEVDDIWMGKDGFENFYRWAINNGFDENLTLDRIDVNKNYNPSNCKWSNAKEQAINRRTTHFITYNGETHSITDWANILGIKKNTLSKRINCYGIDVEKAFTKGKLPNHPNKKVR